MKSCGFRSQYLETGITWSIWTSIIKHNRFMPARIQSRFAPRKTLAKEPVLQTSAAGPHTLRKRRSCPDSQGLSLVIPLIVIRPAETALCALLCTEIAFVAYFEAEAVVGALQCTIDGLRSGVS